MSTERATRDESSETWQGRTVFTIGHSTRSIDELAEALSSFGVHVLADIRTVPRSRHNPQFNAETLERSLAERGIQYVAIPKLGGLRRPRKDSPNAAWRNLSFRGYADYMLTPDFEAGLRELLAATAQGTTAIMCAEAVQWRCHRSLVADALVVRFGLVRSRIPYSSIRSVRATRIPIASPALSLDRLAIDASRGLPVIIAPADRERFVAELAARAPQIAA